MRETRQRYYAALEHESAAQRLFDGQEGPAAGGLRDAAYKEAEGATGLLGVPAPEEVYSELGMRVYRALESLLGSLAGWGRGGTGADAGELRRAVVDAVQPLTRDMDSISARLERQDALLNEIAAGIRRIDRFTLDAFQRLRSRTGYLEPEPVGNTGQGDFGTLDPSEPRGGAMGGVPPRRLAKEETVARALEAARRLRAQGRKLTLKSVAEAAGLKYSQIVYAFGSKEEMLERVGRNGVDVANAS